MITNIQRTQQNYGFPSPTPGPFKSQSQREKPLVFHHQISYSTSIFMYISISNPVYSEFPNTDLDLPILILGLGQKKTEDIIITLGYNDHDQFFSTLCSRCPAQVLTHSVQAINEKANFHLSLKYPRFCSCSRFFLHITWYWFYPPTDPLQLNIFHSILKHLLRH